MPLTQPSRVVIEKVAYFEDFLSLFLPNVGSDRSPDITSSSHVDLKTNHLTSALSSSGTLELQVEKPRRVRVRRLKPKNYNDRENTAYKSFLESLAHTRYQNHAARNRMIDHLDPMAAEKLEAQCLYLDRIYLGLPNRGDYHLIEDSMLHSPPAIHQFPVMARSPFIPSNATPEEQLSVARTNNMEFEASIKQHDLFTRLLRFEVDQSRQHYTATQLKNQSKKSSHR